MKWKNPPIIKIYEAIGSVADGRVEALGDTGKVFSSSGNKYYDVSYDPIEKEIMTNDNGSYWQGYLGYPSIAFLMKSKVLSYSDEVGQLLKGVLWKDLNLKFKNNREKTIAYVVSSKTDIEKEKIEVLVNKVEAEIKKLGFSMLGKKVFPPSGY